MSVIKAVIMAGGSGTRLWPLSTAAHPKQFLALHDNDTMIQATIKRLSSLDIKSTITICNEDHRFFVAEQLREVDKLGSIILEPVGRNTAPAIALAALSSTDDELLLVLSADHVIQDKRAFTKTIIEAIPLAESGKLVTFGIVADRPHDGYGYIKRGLKQGAGYVVNKFVEKPSIKVAEKYLDSGNYYWNSGMFLFKKSRYLAELKEFRPDIYESCESSMKDIQIDADFIRINKHKFEACPSESVDYAVMEKTSDAVVVPMDAGWSDIGSWSSLFDVSKKDSKGNTIYGDVVLYNSSNSYIRSSGKLVVAVGVDDLVVVSSKDAIMVAHKDSVQDVKKIVQEFKGLFSKASHLG